MKNILGKILQELLQKEGSPSVKDFAALMNISTRTVYNVFDGSSSMTFEQVIKATDILGVNIASLYYQRSGKTAPADLLSEDNPKYKTRLNTKAENTVTVSVSITGTIESYENFSKLLSLIKEKSKEYGFEAD